MYDLAFAKPKQIEETLPKSAGNVTLHALEMEENCANRTVLVPTVTAVNKGMKKRKVSRLLFDSGSQRTFITEACSKTLRCKLLGNEILSVGVLGGRHNQRTFRNV
ncbi:hypothetical protein HPB50_018528 [Hyalomma asiaticum]|uniref:Uncharacterized protein n=1 Tax=Hyalomma asiaticum TaxID=266040 RepID=A0ACB7TMJ1_HYAAI|nr:hypothetical protein HPB50_018528 [Hyalomma asiaticum]